MVKSSVAAILNAEISTLSFYTNFSKLFLIYHSIWPQQSSLPNDCHEFNRNLNKPELPDELSHEEVIALKDLDATLLELTTDD